MNVAPSMERNRVKEKNTNQRYMMQDLNLDSSYSKSCKTTKSSMLGSKDLRFYVFRTLICIVGKP